MCGCHHLGFCIEGDRVLLAASTRFMNESGPSYASLAHKQHVEPDRLIAVYDELDIPAGELRVKLGGGSSHNGVKSLQQALASRDFLHVRIGIGRPPGRQDPADFGREPMRREVAERLADMIPHAAQAVLHVLEHGVDSAMQEYNAG